MGRPMSLLDTDFYKFTTGYAVMMKFPLAEAVFEFTDRNKVPRTDEFLEEFKRELKKMEQMDMSPEEFNWLCENVDFMSPWYWEWLRGFRFEYSKMEPYLDEDRVLHVRVCDRWYKSSLYEIPVLYAVPEVQNRIDGNTDKVDMSDVERRTLEKINLANRHEMKFSEFGTRRRFNFDVQDKVVETLKKYSTTCTGTSNVYLAMKYGMKPMGTHPHEWFMAHQIYGYQSCNYMALKHWKDVYQGNLGIALTDTLGTDAFMRNFTMDFAKAFDGGRQDSGDEIEFTNKFVGKYKSFNIDPRTKVIVFSNALDFYKAVRILKYCEGRAGNVKSVKELMEIPEDKIFDLTLMKNPIIQASFGIGTNLTNDVWIILDSEYGNWKQVKAENIVMKMSKFRLSPSDPWLDTIKLSDDLGKHMGPETEIMFAKHNLGIK